MLAIDVRRVRGWLRAGLVEPTPDLDEPRFAFRDLLLLRTLKRLDSELNPRRVRRALAAFKARSPGQSLADLRISTRGARIVVRDATGAFDAASGQRFLDFEAPETSGATVTALRVVPAVDPRLAAADARFKEALVIERDDAQAAESVYREVVALNPEHAEAHINLGCMLHEMGRVLEACKHYGAAAKSHPEDPTGAFNLGVGLTDLGELEEALIAYDLALAADPDFADAHYNAAAICERLGQTRDAIRHLERFRRLTIRPV